MIKTINALLKSMGDYWDEENFLVKLYREAQKQAKPEQEELDGQTFSVITGNSLRTYLKEALSRLFIREYSQISLRAKKELYNKIYNWGLLYSSCTDTSSTESSINDQDYIAATVQSVLLDLYAEYNEVQTLNSTDTLLKEYIYIIPAQHVLDSNKSIFSNLDENTSQASKVIFKPAEDGEVHEEYGDIVPDWFRNQKDYFFFDEDKSAFGTLTPIDNAEGLTDTIRKNVEDQLKQKLGPHYNDFNKAWNQAVTYSLYKCFQPEFKIQADTHIIKPTDQKFYFYTEHGELFCSVCGSLQLEGYSTQRGEFSKIPLGGLQAKLKLGKDGFELVEYRATNTPLQQLIKGKSFEEPMLHTAEEEEAALSLLLQNDPTIDLSQIEDKEGFLPRLTSSVAVVNQSIEPLFTHIDPEKKDQQKLALNNYKAKALNGVIDYNVRVAKGHHRGWNVSHICYDNELRKVTNEASQRCVNELEKSLMHHSSNPTNLFKQVKESVQSVINNIRNLFRSAFRLSRSESSLFSSPKSIKRKASELLNETEENILSGTKGARKEIM